MIRLAIELDVVLIIALSAYCAVRLMLEWRKHPLGAAPWFKLIAVMMAGNVPYWILNLIVFMAYIPELPVEKSWIVPVRFVGLVFPTMILSLAAWLVTIRRGME
jgi:hypothetical protein